MKAYKFNRQDRTFAPWAALCVLSLVAAMVFAAPSVVFAQTYTYELSQDCETAMVGTEHTITATVTDENGAPVAEVRLIFMVYGDGNNPYLPPFSILTNADGIAEITMYTRSNPGQDDIKLTSPPNPFPLATISTEWTAEDLCLTPHVEVGGKVTLNAKKRGALKIAVCGTEDFEVSNVDPKSVLLAGVEPWHWKQKDSRLCLDGKDGFVDLVFKFKNREVVEAALEKDLGKELVDGDKDVPLALTGNLYDLTAFGGEWVAEIKKKGKRHGKNEQYQDHKNGKGKGFKK